MTKWLSSIYIYILPASKFFCILSCWRVTFNRLLPLFSKEGLWVNQRVTPTAAYTLESLMTRVKRMALEIWPSQTRLSTTEISNPDILKAMVSWKFLQEVGKLMAFMKLSVWKNLPRAILVGPGLRMWVGGQSVHSWSSVSWAFLTYSLRLEVLQYPCHI